MTTRVKSKKRPTSSRRIPSLAQCERVLGPASKWPGRCFELASKLVSEGLVDGVAVYGHWLGEVAKGCIFDRNMPFCRHGWVLLPDGQVLDPTRWVFEGKKPYIYVGSPGREYDEGGNFLRAVEAGTCPERDPDDYQIEFSQRVLPSAPWNHVEELMGEAAMTGKAGVLSFGQVMWLANLPIQMLQPHAEAIYRAIEAVGKGALIPWDNRQMAKRGDA